MNILYVDQDIVVAVKPCGVLSQDSEKEKGMPEMLTKKLGGPIFCVHRLDRDTAGVMVFARNSKSAAALSDAIARRNVTKEYLAVFSGRMEEKEGFLEDFLFFDRKKGKVFPVKRERKGVKKAQLHYRILEETDTLSLAKVCPITGRTHQIRVQFASRQHPLFGDRKYGGSQNTLGLFSHTLRFSHPETGEELFFSQLPPSKTPWTHFSFSKLKSIP